MAFVSFVVLVATLVVNGGLPTGHGGMALLAMLALLAFMPRLTLHVLKFALPVAGIALLVGTQPPEQVGPTLGVLLRLGIVCLGFYLMLRRLFRT